MIKTNKNKNKFKNKKSNNSSFFILIFEISRFQNILRSTFDRYECSSPRSQKIILMKTIAYVTEFGIKEYPK